MDPYLERMFFLIQTIFLYKFWTNITTIGSVNVTWWTLEIMPGSSTTTHSIGERGQQVKKKSVERKQKNKPTCL